MQTLGAVTIVVRAYDEAKRWYTRVLGFTLVDDRPLPDGKRWLLLKPPGGTGASVLLAEASAPEQAAVIGGQAGGRVWLFLHTDDFRADYHAMRARDVPFEEEPRVESYGTVAVFRDLYGNRWDLIEPRRDRPPDR